MAGHSQHCEGIFPMLTTPGLHPGPRTGGLRPAKKEGSRGWERTVLMRQAETTPLN